MVLLRGPKKEAAHSRDPCFSHEYERAEEIPIASTVERCHELPGIVMSLNYGTLGLILKIKELDQERSKKPRRMASLTAAGRLRT